MTCPVDASQSGEIEFDTTQPESTAAADHLPSTDVLGQAPGLAVPPPTTDPAAAHTFSIDPETWAQWDADRKKMWSCRMVSDVRFSGFCCVLPQCVFYVPCGGLAVLGSCCCSAPDIPLPDHHQEALVLTPDGVKGYIRTRKGYYCPDCYVNNEKGGFMCCGYTEEYTPAELSWDAFEMDQEENGGKPQVGITVTKPPWSCLVCDDSWRKYDRDLSLVFGFGLPLFPCCCLTYSQHNPKYYDLRIPSTAGEWRGGDENGNIFEPDYDIKVRALKEDASIVLQLLRDGKAGKIKA